jgi:hypothetical protein
LMPHASATRTDRPRSLRMRSTILSIQSFS